MQNTAEKIYCAGPLFTSKEREEMEQIAGALEEAGYATFLPQRDGLELTKCMQYLVDKGTDPREAGHLMSQAIFALDVYQVLHACNALVANLNGRVPDEGTVSEAAMAWARGKPVIGYKADSRTAFGGQDNPLVAGLFAFDLCQTIEGVIAGVQKRLKAARSVPRFHAVREKEIEGYVSLGSAISAALERSGSLQEVIDAILSYRSATAHA